MNYRKIYKEHFGEIPKDKNNKTYDIHHIDRNKENNSIDNLIALSLEDHFKEHYDAGEFREANLIAMRMKKSKKELSKLASLDAKKRVKNGTHHWCGGEMQRKNAKKQIENGTHYFLTDEHRKNVSKNNKKLIKENKHNFQSTNFDHKKHNKDMIKNGTHPLLKKQDGSSVGAESSRKRIKNGTHHFLNSNIQRKNAEKAKLKNSYILEYFDNNQSIFFIGYSAAEKYFNINRRKIKKMADSGIDWKIHGKGISSTTIPKGSTIKW